MIAPTALNLFFVQEMLKPANPRAWELFVERAWTSANREAVNAKRRKRYAANPEKYKAAVRASYAANPENHRAASRAYSALESNRAAINTRQRARYAKDPTEYLAATRLWTKKNPDKARKIHRDYVRGRKAKDPEYKTLCCLRARIYDAVKGLRKSETTRELLGMEIKEFKIYLQGQFLPGMTWENHGAARQIDHIRPCASFDLTDPAQQRECFNWSNCQPLFAEDNLKKGANGR